MRKIIFVMIFCLAALTSAAVYAKNTDELFETLEARAVYTDENGVIKMAAFKIDEVPEDMTFEIQGEKFDVTQGLESGIVFQDTDTEKTAVSEENITFSADGKSVKLSFPVIRIVEGKEDEWTVSDDGHRLYTYNGSDETVVAPNYYNNKPVLSIGGQYDEEAQTYINVLGGKTEGFKKMILSDGITGISHYAFRNISTLEDIEFSNSLRTIGAAAFYNTALNCDIVLPPTMENIYPNAFRSTNITSLKLNDGLKNIQTQAFALCKNLSGELYLPPSLTQIGTSAFNTCPGLTGGLVIPSSVKEVGDGAFYNCSGLNGDVVISEGVESVGQLSFAGYKVYMAITGVKFPSTLKKIGPYCFQNCSSIKSIELNEGLETISDGAFDHCSGAENDVLVIPSTVKVIGGDYNVKENTGYGDHTFYDFGKDAIFKAFEVAEGNQYFDAYEGVLYDKDHTRLIAYPRGRTDEVFALPDTVTQLDALSFSRPAYLKKLVLPNSYILQTEVPKNSLNTDGNNLSVALYGYNNIEEIAVNDDNENYTVKDGLLYSKDMKTLWYIPLAAKGDIRIDERCENMEKGSIYIASAAKVCWNSLVIGENVQTISDDVIDFINSTIKGKVVFDNNFYYTTDKKGKVIAASYKYGDADLSGTIDDADAELVLAYVSGIDIDKTINHTAADANRDGFIDLIDVIAIKALAE